MEQAPPTDAAEVEAAVQSLHQVFEAWFAGSLPASREAFEPVERALGPGFVLVSPDGRASERAPLLESLFGAHGSQRSSPLRISVRIDQVSRLREGLLLARYQEWHETPTGRTGRRSSALFRREPDGLLWLHVHETWMGN